MNKNPGRKKVLITGCSSGFGLLTAVETARLGYEVIATMRNMKKAEYLQMALDQAGVNAAIEHLDVTDHAQIAEIAQKHSPVDVLINNAGMSILGSFLDITDEEMHRVFNTNYFGVVALTRAIVPGMIQAGSGLIINVTSLAGRVGHPCSATYSATKHALIGFTRSIRLELKAFNINVVSVEPGYHKTEILRANVNLSENFYNPDSPMIQYNRGYLRLMRDYILPRAGEAQNVVRKILRVMKKHNPRSNYLVGKDAHLAIAARRLGLMRLVENEILHKLQVAARRETRRANARAARKRK
jgi:short-subunit dehydrogenase